MGRGRGSDVTLAVAVGGALGAAARYGISSAWSPHQTGFPWATLTVNLVGSLLIGVLMALILDVWVSHRLLRPFLGVGVLGGFTTFSTYALETLTLIRAGALPVAGAYLLGTVLGALAAVWLGAHLTRIGVRRHRRRDRP